MANKYNIPNDPRYPRTQADRDRVAEKVRNAKVEDIPKPNNIIELGIYLRNLGISVTEHSLFGGVADVHEKDSKTGRRISEHYFDKALDINLTVDDAGTPWARAIFDQLESKLRAAGWTDILWKTKNHYNHMHIGTPGSAGGKGKTTTKPNPTPNGGEGAAPDAGAEAAAKALQQFGKFAPNSERNILSNYRSWNYNIAIAGLPANWEEEVKDTKAMDKVINDYHIIDSSGKFGKGEVPGGGISTSLKGAEPFKKFLDEYNENSPGRFDFFIDDVVIISNASNGTLEAGPASTFKIEFTVFEPYGMNGFMEALYATSYATNWINMDQMWCVMKIWFTGYPDDIELPKPEIIPDSTRYFKIKMAQISAEINEEGTRYRVSCISASDIALGTANHLFAPVTIKGATVYEQIQSYFRGINVSIQNQKDGIAPTAENGSIRDCYEVSFPNFDVDVSNRDPIKDGMVYSDLQDVSLTPTDKHSLIVKALMPVPGKDTSQPATADPSAKPAYAGSKDLSGRAPQPLETTTAQVDSYICAADRQIHQQIVDIILRSDYVSKGVLQDQLQAAKSANSDGFINYFKIKTETFAGKYDVVRNRYSRIYRYIVMPYKIHYTEIPGQEQGTADYTPVLKQIRREYNYLFTGKNIDIIKCNISYNNLYYTGTQPLFGNDPNSKGTQTKDGPAGTVEIKQPESERAKAAQAGDTTKGASPAPAIETTRAKMTPGLLQFVQSDDPYTRFAQEVNNFLLQRNGLKDPKFTSVDIEILGDPYYITSHNAEYVPPKDQQTTGEGSARVNNTDVHVNMNFRSLRDIYKNDGKPGLADFGDKIKLLPFSGVYRVMNIESYFKGGVFTQKLAMQRGDAQIITLQPAQPAADLLVTRSSLPGSQVVVDSADPSVNRHGVKEDSIDFSKFFNRGLPTVGLPGSPADFTAVVSKTQSALLSKVPGATAQFASLTGPDPANAAAATSGIKISPSALQSVVTDAKAAAVGVAGGLMEQVGNIQDAAKNLANDMVKQASSLGDKLEQEVSNLEDDFASAVGDAKNKVQKLQNAITTDPSGIASKLGIDPAKMTGLSKELSTKLTEELNKVADLVPPNANLAGLERAGVVFSNMVGSKLANLPPLQPSTPAPKPIFDAARVAITDSNGNVIPLLNGQANLAALTEINNVKNSLGQVATGYGTKMKSVSQTILDKVGTVQLSVDNITALSLGVSSPVGSLGENSPGVPAPASVGLGSKENNSGRVDALVQATGNVKAAQANITLASQVGSKSASSPLTTLVNNSNIQGKLV